MHECKGSARLVVVIKVPKVESQFNSNYKSGIEVLEDAVAQEFVGMLPAEWLVEFEDIEITNYEHKQAEREVEND